MTNKMNLWNPSTPAPDTEIPSEKKTGQTGLWKREEKPVEAGEWERPPGSDAGDEEYEKPYRRPNDRRFARNHWRMLQPDQVRRVTMTFSVTQEEADLFRAHAEKLPVSFSNWARTTLFKAMGRKPPKRKMRFTENE
jgi:hypothetical protein